jgi:hypothetical protein
MGTKFPCIWLNNINIFKIIILIFYILNFATHSATPFRLPPGWQYYSSPDYAPGCNWEDNIKTGLMTKGFEILTSLQWNRI